MTLSHVSAPKLQPRKEAEVKSRKVVTTAFCVSALTLAGCSGNSSAGGSGSCEPLAEMTKVTLGVNPGAQDLVISAMQEQGIAKKYNLDLDVKSFLNPPASAAAVIQKAVDVGFGGNTTMAVARAQGSDVFFFGMIAKPVNQVFVPKDSSISSLSELEGKKLGSFSGTNSGTFSVLSVVAAKTASMSNLGEDTEVVEAPDAALVGLLDQGNIDAMLSGSTGTVQAMLSGQYKSISDLSGDYEDATGQQPTHVGSVTTESYASSHCGELIAVSKALRDATDYVKNNDEVWTDYAAELEMTDPDAPEMLRKVLGPSFTSEWNRQRLEANEELLASMIPILGTEDFISEVPDGLFSLDYSATK